MIITFGLEERCLLEKQNGWVRNGWLIGCRTLHWIDMVICIVKCSKNDIQRPWNLHLLITFYSSQIKIFILCKYINPPEIYSLTWLIKCSYWIIEWQRIVWIIWITTHINHHTQIPVCINIVISYIQTSIKLPIRELTILSTHLHLPKSQKYSKKNTVNKTLLTGHLS